MSKISKNIRRLRNEKGFTQDVLAEKINVSRQAISSWENDRTQPDVQMLENLSEVFGVSIEELIYGKKRNVGIEMQKEKYNNTLVIVFSVLGAILVGIGAILIFVTGWEKLPFFIKSVLSFVPILAGQGAGVYVLLKKRDKLPWCEGASVLWTAGIAATAALVHTVFDLGVFVQDWYLVISLSIIPVMFLLKAVSPLPVYYLLSYLCFYFKAERCTFYREANIKTLFYFTMMVLSFALGVYFIRYLVSKEKYSLRVNLMMWLSAIAFIPFFFFAHIIVSESFSSMLCCACLLGLCYFILGQRYQNLSQPFKPLGLFICCVGSVVLSSLYYLDIDEIGNAEIYPLSLCLILIALSLIFIKGRFSSKLNSASAALYFALGVVTIWVMSVFKFDGSGSDIAMILILKALNFAFLVLIIVGGAAEMSLFQINLGFISVMALIGITIISLNADIFVLGVSLLVCGIVLLLINFRMVKTKKDKIQTAKEEE